MTDDDARSRRLFDWVMDHIRLVAVMVALMWIVMAVMCFGIITNARNATDAAKRTRQIIEQNDIDAQVRSERSTEDRARLELLVRTIREAEKCVSLAAFADPPATAAEIVGCFKPVPDPPPGFLPDPPKK